MKRILTVLLVLVMALSMTVTATAAEVGATTIDTDTTWTNATTLSGNLTVNSGVTLTISEQVTITGDVTISGGGRIVSDNATITGTTIGNTSYNNMFLVSENAALTLQNITINGGATWGSSDTGGYKAVLGHDLTNTGLARTGARAAMIQVLANGTITLKSGAVLENNDAPSSCGGAIRNDGGTTNIERDAIIRNIRSSSGAVGQITGTLSMSGGSLEGNAAVQTDGYGGGALRIQGAATITGGSIRNNWCDADGGGISVTFVEDAEIGIKNVAITGNYAAKSGGGIQNKQSKKVTIESVDLSNNSAGEAGGGFFSDAAVTTFKNTTITGNTADHGSGLNGTGDVTIQDCTITGNQGNYAPALYFPMQSEVVFSGKNTVSNNTVNSDSQSTVSPETQVVVAKDGLAISGALTGSTIVGIDFHEGNQGNLADIAGANQVIVSGKNNYEVTNADLATLVFVSRFYKDDQNNTYGIFADTGKGYRKAAIAVTFHANDSTTTTKTQYVLSDTATELLPNTFSRSGYTFQGWNTQADGTGTAYADKASLTTATTVDLYAQWAAVVTPDSGPSYTPPVENTVTSAKTFDAGIALYGVMALTSAMGAVYVTKKHH